MYAKDATEVGSLTAVKAWRDEIVIAGSAFGYDVNPTKTWLILEENGIGLAVEIFGNRWVHISQRGS